MHLHKKLDTLLARALKLVSENKRLTSKNDDLLKEIAGLKQQMQEELRKTGELNNQIKIIKLAQNINTGNTQGIDNKELKQKLNEYIKEIDHCMAMLNE